MHEPLGGATEQPPPTPVSHRSHVGAPKGGGAAHLQRPHETGQVCAAAHEPILVIDAGRQESFVARLLDLGKQSAGSSSDDDALCVASATGTSRGRSRRPRSGGARLAREPSFVGGHLAASPIGPTLGDLRLEVVEARACTGDGVRAGPVHGDGRPAGRRWQRTTLTLGEQRLKLGKQARMTEPSLRRLTPARHHVERGLQRDDGRLQRARGSRRSACPATPHGGRDDPGLRPGQARAHLRSRYLR